MSERKKPGVAFWATVVVAVLVLYLASSGPAMWIRDSFDSKTADACFMWAYSPLIWLVDNGPAPIQDLLLWWANLWT